MPSPVASDSLAEEEAGGASVRAQAAAARASRGRRIGGRRMGSVLPEATAPRKAPARGDAPATVGPPRTLLQPRRRRSAFVTTLTELIAMAPAAIIGPVAVASMPSAAKGTAAKL